MNLSKEIAANARAYRAANGGSWREAISFVTSRPVLFGGELISRVEAARRLGIGRSAIGGRIKGGGPVDRPKWARAKPRAAPRKRMRRSRWSKLLRARSGSVVVVSVRGDVMTVRCDCGRVCDKSTTAFYRRNITCGDREAHRPARSPVVAYLYDWHLRRTVCAGWEDVATFVASVGERPAGHVLSKTGTDVASCGACEDCKALGAACNVVWTKGQRARAPAVPCRGEMVSQSEAAKILGISKTAVALRMAAGTPLDAPKGETGRRRGKGKRLAQVTPATIATSHE